MKKFLKTFLDKLSDMKLYILTFVFSTIVILIAYIINDVTPFGDKSLLCVDFYHQYGPMLGELYDRVIEGKNLIYSFSMSMGLPFFRNYLNYMSSPFNLLIFLFPREDLVTSYSYIIGLRAIVSSVTFVYFISHKFKTKELTLIPLGVLYAFSAFFISYYWNIMWLDGMVFLPLITLGIEYIIKERKWKFYTIFLAIMLISNYFISYMICIYSVLYFIVFALHEFHLTKKDIINTIKSCLLFALGSITAALIAAAFIVPMAYSMKSISATGGTFPKTQYYDFTQEDYLKSHMTGATTTTFASDVITHPNISTGILTVALLILFIVNLEIPVKTKLCYLFILGFIIAAFFDPALDYIMHAFHVPNDLPYRYSFLYVFTMMTIASYALINIKKSPYLLTASVYVFVMLLLLLIHKDDWQGLTKNIVYINMILLTLYFIFYTGIKIIKDLRTPFFIALAITAVIDVSVSININWSITQVLATFYEDYNKTEELLTYVKNYDNSNFYRIENTQNMTLNDGSWYNYNGMTTFSSMAYESMAKLQNFLGMPGNKINSYSYVQSTPIYDLMFDIKYFIGISNDKTRYTKIYEDEETVNEFKYNVGLGFATNNRITEWQPSSDNPFANENEFIRYTTSQNDVLIKMKPTFVKEIFNDGVEYIVEYEFKNPKDNMYFYTDSYYVDFFIIGNCLYDLGSNYYEYGEEQGVIYEYVDDYNEHKVVNIASSDDKVYITVGYKTYSELFSDEFYMYYLDQTKFLDAYKEYNDNRLYINSFKENDIKASISTDKSFVYTSIPYDEGWTVYVDGKEVEKEKIGKALLGFKIEPGNHEIRLLFIPKGQKIGLIGTIIGIMILLIDIIFKQVKAIIKPKKKQIKKNRHA
ncbi:MAG: YfhO family protein [Bacilli bacterium]|nr:YfhO family protein [Bacilli bacterium]